MKILITSMIILLTTTPLWPQQPIIEVNKTWNVAQCSSAAPICTTLLYKFGNSVILNGKCYTEMLISKIDMPENWNIAGYLREDGSGLSYFLSTVTAEEVLLYNFSLETKDTVELKSIGYGQCCVSITTVDSVKTVNYNGVNRKTLYVSSTINTENNPHKTQSVWIEGIGSLWGVLQPVNCMYVGGYHYLLCSSIDDRIIYKNPNESSCIISSTNEKELQHKVQISNSINSIAITNSSSEKINISLFNLEGKAQGSITIAPNTTGCLSTNTLPKGIYIISIKANTFSFGQKVSIP